MIKDRVSKLEKRQIEFTQVEQQRGKWIDKKSKQSPRNLGKILKYPILCSLKSQKERKKRVELKKKNISKNKG